MAKTIEEAKEDARRRARLWYHNNKARHNAITKEWRRKNRDKVNASVRQKYSDNKTEISAYRRDWNSRNKESNVASKKKYRDNNRDRVRQSAREYVARRRETDANFKIRSALRGRIWTSLKAQGVSKNLATQTLTACDGQFLRGFLEARFQPGMSWANYGRGKGKWNVDHVIPCAEFDLRDPAQQKQCFHYSNLKPMWERDNILKSNKRPPTHQAELI